MVSNNYRIICCEFFDIILCMSSSISCSLFFFIIEINYASYRHYSVSLIVIDLDKGGIDKMKLQPSLENW